LTRSHFGEETKEIGADNKCSRIKIWQKNGDGILQFVILFDQRSAKVVKLGQTSENCKISPFL